MCSKLTCYYTWTICQQIRGAHLAQQLHVEVFSGALGTILAKDVGFMAAIGAQVAAHVLYDAQDGHSHISKHCRAPPCIYEGNVLLASSSLWSSALAAKGNTRGEGWGSTAQHDSKT